MNNPAQAVILMVTASILLLSVVSQTSAQEKNEHSREGAASYMETYRPQFHFTPSENWINDPNGLVYHNGEYHLFYQHNPFGNQWGHMSWGHAVSSDLLHWQHLPVALPEENNVMIFSGSAVSDVNNTSGLGTEENPPLVAIYTGHHTDKELQDQRIAYSLDNGRSWTKFKNNPVIDEGMKNFRDPKVIWHEQTKKWVMIVALPDEHKVRFYGSSDLIQWEHLSDFGPAGATEGIWECPDLFKLPVDGDSENSKWVLQVDLNPGAVAGGSGGQYFIGSFDGKTFRKDPGFGEEARWVDYGKDFYAVQSYSGIPAEDGRRIWLAWMNNWQYAGEIPTDPWRGAMTLPRTLSLQKINGTVHLVQQPVNELQGLRQSHHHIEDLTVNGIPGVLREKGIEGNRLEILARFENKDAEVFGINVLESDTVKTTVGYDTGFNEVFVDRSRSGETGFSEHFPGRHKAKLISRKGEILLHIFVDWSSVELFANNGEVTVTDRVFPYPESRQLSLFSKGGAVQLTSLDIWELESVWENDSKE